MNPNPAQRRTLADIISEKLAEKKTAMTGTLFVHIDPIIVFMSLYCCFCLSASMV